MDPGDILMRAARMTRQGVPFALATVVRRTPPSSARPGRKLLVGAAGESHGWLGGSCIEPEVRRVALEAMRDGRPRLVVFSPDADGVGPRAGPGQAAGGPAGTLSGGPADAGPAEDDPPEDPPVVIRAMTCHSGGRVEVYVEPQMPKPVLALFGDSPVSRALAAMAPAAGLRVVAVGVDGAAEAYAGVEAVEALEGAGYGDGPSGGAGGAAPGGGPHLYCVVATLGEWDEGAARQALEAGAAYVGLVASPRRAEELRRRLRRDGVPEEWLERIHSPAGLDLGAEEPGEIAVSVLAEVVQRRRSAAAVDEGPGSGPLPGNGPPEEAAGDVREATDPVCGMAVDPSSARHAHTHDGTEYHFCCAGCREAFVDDPERYLA